MDLVNFTLRVLLSLGYVVVTNTILPKIWSTFYVLQRWLLSKFRINYYVNNLCDHSIKNPFSITSILSDPANGYPLAANFWGKTSMNRRFTGYAVPSHNLMGKRIGQWSWKYWNRIQDEIRQTIIIGRGKRWFTVPVSSINCLLELRPQHVML